MASPEQEARITLARVQDDLLFLRGPLELLGVDIETAGSLHAAAQQLRQAIMQARRVAGEKIEQVARGVPA